MLYATDDTIVAICSPPGHGARGIVRLSGPQAVRIATALFGPDDGVELASLPGFSRAPGRLRLGQQRSLPAECYVFRAPRSYTRQDCVELHTLGAPPLLAMLVDAAIAGGARSAEPGEFTARAFLSGAMDLAQAEAVAAIIAARSDAELRAGRRVQAGDLSRRTSAAAEQLAELVALVEADIDFSEEPIDFITPAELGSRLDDLRASLSQLLQQAASQERLSHLPTVLLLGAANAGKSTLMNALTGMNRAICSAVAGTTRDLLSAPLALSSGEAILVDAAGQTDDPAALLAHLAHQATEAAARQADLVCLVVDIAQEPGPEVWRPIRMAGACRAVIAANKVDLVDQTLADRRVAALARPRVGRVCRVSAIEGTGLPELREVLGNELAGHAASSRGASLALTARQRGCLEACRTAIQRARQAAADAAETIDCADLVATDLRQALDAIGEVTGAITTEDLLGRIFGSFCVGK